MMDTEDNGRTILDYLNEDCWYEVLSYVHIQNILRTERASRHWQGVVLRYLRGVSITVVEDDYRRKEIHPKACILKQSEYESFERWTHKLGSSVVATYCNSWESLQTIRVTCPNLEALELVRMRHGVQESFQHNLNEDFKCLKRLCFKVGCPEVTDHRVNQFVADKALEELKFEYCSDVTGQCLNTMNLSNLKSLIFDSCRGLKTEHILSAVEKLGELAELKLIYIDYELAEKIQPVLDKMPKLEQLEVYSDISPSCHTSKALCSLTRLRHLKVSFQLHDDDVDAVTRCCKELRSLVLLDCECMTALGAQAICRNAGARLTSLELLTCYELEDDDVVAIIRGCPALTSLNVSGTGLLRPALPARAAAARLEARPARPLRLDLTDTSLDNDDFLNNYDGEELEEMKRQYEDMNNKYGSLIIVIEPEH